MRHLKVVRNCFLTALALFLGAGCAANVNPWERGNLAKPQMALEPNVLDSALMKHAYSSKEAASGGYGVGGGGCGCN
jgi:hypothetical protein